MRLLTWNLCRGPLERKYHAVEAVGYDIAVLQEVAKIDLPSDHACWFGRNPRQGMAVLTSAAYTMRLLPWDEELPQLIVPIEVRGPRCFTLLAVWALLAGVNYLVRPATTILAGWKRGMISL
jgi:hypothetical protein